MMREGEEAGRGGVSRRGLVAALAVAGCATEAPPPPRPPAPMPAPALMAWVPPPPEPEPELALLRDGPRVLTIAGESLDAAPLRRFYARHGFQPVWESRPEQAAALTAAVASANRHGLDPSAFHAAALIRRAGLPPLERELLLSAAALSYADALAHGRVPAGRRRPAETLAPPPRDVESALGAVAAGRAADAALEELAPDAPAYAALRAALAGAVLAGGGPPGRLRPLQVNLERQRWLPRRLPLDRIWVNVADQQLTLFQGGEPALSCRVVVGGEGEREQSPELQAMVEGIFFNPPWVVPADIVERDILPRLAQDPTYLERRNMVLRDNGEVEQRPGPGAGLGVLLFDMPNRFDVFLHDTPAREFFSRGARRLSYGCIRVEKPRELASLLMRRPMAAVEAEIARGVTHRLDLPAPVPVFLVYQTAFADAEGRVQLRPDFYDRDPRLWQELQGRAAAGPA
ncbi:L,D-transpeptidase family protein [Roseococcus sp. DSY-14]|uniref:L,D-transpeptidase family protein n=1 Tax=Roseococcus sp. DSY-14 TaxID=3369650 RepID=UPI00387AAE37